MTTARRAADLSVEERAADVTAAMQAIIPGDQLPFLMQLSIEPVLATIRDEPAPIGGGGSRPRPGGGGTSR